MQPCPSTDTIAELVCRQLADVRVVEVEAHVADCADCRRVVGTLAAASLPRLARGSLSAELGRDVDRGAAGGDPQRYVIRKELARGGMGRISSADDTFLNRTVAIKELLAPNPALAARFRRELSLTARLQHPSIVSIHDGGTWPDGDPFYVMRLVSGEPLDRVIARHDTVAARLGLLPHGIATVDALAYAHSQGIIHRDLKPSNILVGDFGETVVIDWGLAKDLRSADAPEPIVAGSPATPAATIAGLVIGTPAYMAPEQARGAAVDERADVYALGAVLYHLLGGVAPHTGRDVDEVVRAVASVAPMPLGERAAGIPADLLTIVGKAMSQQPGDRYATAGELAIDLKRFQRGQLVGAHRYSRWELAQRWTRKHRAAVAVAAIAVVVIGGTAVTSFRRVVAEQHHAERDRANAEELMSFMLWDLRDKLEPIGKLDLLGAVARKARDYYQQRPDDNSSDGQYKRLSARANLGQVLQGQGDAAGALVELRAAVAIATKLTADDPENATWQHELSANRRRVGEVLETQGNATAAMVEYEATLAGDQALAHRDPANAIAQSDLAQSLIKVGGIVEARGKSADALADYRAALAIVEQLAIKEPDNPVRRRELYICHSYLGNVLEVQGDAAAALVEYRSAKAIAKARVERTPADSEAQRDLWLERIAIGKLLVSQGDADAALEELRGSTAIAELLVARDPQNVTWQRDLSASHNEVGDVLLTRGDASAALTEFRAAQVIVQRLTEQLPSNADVARDVIVSHGNVGGVLESQGDTGAALVEYRGALAIAEQLLAKDTTSVNAQSDVLNAHNDIGSALEARGDNAGALSEFRAAFAITGALVARDPTNADSQRTRWAVQTNIGDILMAQKAAVDATREFQAAAAIAKTLAERQPDNAQAQADLSVSHTKIGSGLAAQGSLPAALGEYRDGLAIAEKLVAQDPKNVEWAKSVTTLRQRIAALHR